MTMENIDFIQGIVWKSNYMHTLYASEGSAYLFIALIGAVILRRECEIYDPSSIYILIFLRARFAMGVK